MRLVVICSCAAGAGRQEESSEDDSWDDTSDSGETSSEDASWDDISSSDSGDEAGVFGVCVGAGGCICICVLACSGPPHLSSRT